MHALLLISSVSTLFKHGNAQLAPHMIAQREGFLGMVARPQAAVSSTVVGGAKGSAATRADGMRLSISNSFVHQKTQHTKFLQIITKACASTGRSKHLAKSGKQCGARVARVARS